MPKPYPKEFRDDVVAVARKGDSTIRQIAQDFGISESCLANWLKQADVEDGMRPGVTAAEAAESRELKKRIRLLEQENEVLRRAAASLSQANLKLGQVPPFDPDSSRLAGKLQVLIGLPQTSKNL